MANKQMMFAWLTSSMVLLYLIYAVEGSSLGIYCTFDNCTSTQNTYCNEGFCTCMPGFKDKDHHCQLRKIGEGCSNDTDCMGVDNSQCVNDICQCVIGYLPKNQSKDCALRRIGDKCNEDNDCSYAIANSQCDSEEKCRCPVGFILKGSSCVARKLGDACVKGSDCTEVMNNARCLKKNCTCLNLYIEEDEYTCRLRRLGDSCVKNVECDYVAGETRVCDKKLCACAKGYRQISNDTMKDLYCAQIRLGDPCSKPVDCFSVTNSFCNDKKICQCQAGLKPSNDNDMCEVIRLHDACLNHTDCQHINYSACMDRKCSCIAGYKEHQSEDEALPCRIRVIGDACQNDSDCGIASSFCKQNICACIRGFRSSNESSQCIESFLDETECTPSEDCQELYNNTICLGGLCQCQRRYYLDESRHQCLFRYLGDSCQTQGECELSVPNSDCVSTLCQCKPTHMPTSARTSCIIKRLGGMQCRSDNDCELRVPHSLCDNNNSSTCYCSIGYYSNEKFDGCIEKLLHDPCTFDEQCNTTNSNSFCSLKTQRCECLPEFIATFQNRSELLSSTTAFSKPFCFRRIIGDQSCETKDECTLAIANSTCGPCREAIERSPCRQRCEADGVADTDMMAPDTLNATSGCSARTCLCEKGFTSRNDPTRCVGIRLREPCKDDGDCSVHTANSVCLMNLNVCYCASGFREEGIDVCKRRKIGDRCTEPSDCADAVTFSHCNFSRNNNERFGVCSCNSGYQVKNINTECQKRQIGDRTCAVNTDCSDAVNNSYCDPHHYMCVCLPGYYLSFDNTQCYKRRLHSDYCDTVQQCSAVINNSICENYKCVCLSGFYDRNEGECVKRNIYDNCTIRTDCSDAVNHSTCVNRTCECVSGFLAKGDDLCVKRRVFDSDCVNNDDCANAVQNSRCINDTCECETGYYASNDNNMCIQRKLEDTCNTSSDCRNVISNSDCVRGLCTCAQGFDAYSNNSQCVTSPTNIGDLCYFTEQCQKIDNVSTCNLTHGINGTCVCPPGTFRARNKTSCIKFPVIIGEYCFRDYHCQQRINNTFCNISSCNCSSGYFVDINKTICHRDPQTLGDYCQESNHCLKTMEMSKCEPENNTCVCEYGYTQVTGSKCVERNILPQHSTFAPPTIAVCQNKCTAWTNSRCVTPPGSSQSQCQCDYRHARVYNSNQCVPVQTYEFDLTLTKQADKYDYIPINVTDEGFADRITLSGLMVMFEESGSPLRDRYVASKVTRVESLDKPKQWTDKVMMANILLHLTANYLNATPIRDIFNFIEESLNRSDGVLGKSSLKVAIPFRDALVFRDFDECADVEHSDCSRYATCINTLGSFMCVCNSRFEDVSKLRNLRPGRECARIPTTTDNSSDLCSSNDCETRWEFVGLAVTLFLLIVMAFITYEIIQRKQTFTARKLYEKFGTTKIRKLQQASMKRLQERKKRKKEENKKQKEEEKQKKEELKREKSEKRKMKDEEKKAKQEEKKKDAKKGQREEKSDDGDVEWLGDRSETDNRPPSPMETTRHPPLLPIAAPADESHVIDISSLPGSVNTPDMGFVRRVISPIEESPV